MTYMEDMEKSYMEGELLLHVLFGIFIGSTANLGSEGSGSTSFQSSSYQVIGMNLGRAHSLC